jgi:Spy/CpxP family protein refolding chaperone
MKGSLEVIIMKPTRIVLLSALIGLAGFCGGWALQPSYGQQTDVSVGDAEGNDWANCLRAHMQNRFFKGINATVDQKEKLSELFKSTMEQNRETRVQVKNQFASLIDLFADGKASDDQIRKQFEDLKASREKLAAKRLDLALKVRTILTPDQLKLVGDRFKNRMENWKGFASD